MKLKSTVSSGNKYLEEEESLALAIDHAIGDHLETYADELYDAYSNVLKIILLGGAVVAAALYWSLGTWVLLGGVAIAGYGLLGASGIGDEDPPVRVKRARKRYWTAYAFPRGDGTLLFDATGATETTTFDLERLDDPKTLSRARAELSEMESFPTVMDREDNVERRIREHLEGIHAELTNANSITLEAPVVEGGHPVLRGLESVAGEMVEGRKSVDLPYDLDDAAETVEAIEDLEQLAFDSDPAEQLESLKRDADDAVSHVVETQSDAIEMLNDHVETAGDLLATTSYNFYCPTCLIDDVESPLEGSFADGAEWYCETCTRTFDEEIVVPKHRMKDEVIEDVWDQLWIEKDDERRRVYESIEDQKSELAEREYEQRREEIRTATDRIKDRRAKLRDLKTRARAGKGKVDEIGSLMVKYRGLNEQRKNEFREEVERKAAKIDRETSKLIEETRNIEQERLEEAEKRAEENARMIEAEQERRHRERLAMQHAIAEAAHESAAANRFTAAATHEMAGDVKELNRTMETIEDHKKKEFLLETRGSVSQFDTINEMHMKKGAITGFTPAKRN